MNNWSAFWNEVTRPYLHDRAANQPKQLTQKVGMAETQHFTFTSLSTNGVKL